MDQTNTIAALQALTSKTKMARFRSLLRHIEVALAAGATHQMIVDELNRAESWISLGTFRIYLNRSRKKTRSNPANSSAKSPETNGDSKLSKLPRLLQTRP